MVILTLKDQSIEDICESYLRIGILPRIIQKQLSNDSKLWLGTTLNIKLYAYNDNIPEKRMLR